MFRDVTWIRSPCMLQINIMNVLFPCCSLNTTIIVVRTNCKQAGVYELKTIIGPDTISY